MVALDVFVHFRDYLLGSKPVHSMGLVDNRERYPPKHKYQIRTACRRKRNTKIRPARTQIRKQATMEASDPKHIRKRVQVRVSDTNQLNQAIRRLDKALKNPTVKKKYGQVEWYYPVKDGQDIHCYVVGKGVVLCSVLTADMIPYGKDISEAVR
jgi:hypothetical protein